MPSWNRSDTSAQSAVLRRARTNLVAWDHVAPDGEQVRVWSNQAGVPSRPDAVPVIACAGLGTPPESWPTLLAQPERFELYGAYYRGTMGSPQPDRAPTVDDHVGDLVALMDDRGIERAVLLGWSMGVTLACELALRHPERVAGILGVAGVPGDTFSALAGPLPVPRVLRRPLGFVGARALSLGGPVLNAALRTVPLGPTTWVLRHTIALPRAGGPYFDALVGEFLHHDYTWYFRMAAASARHPRIDLSRVRVPVELIGGRWDVITSASHIAECADELPDGRFDLLPGSHFLVSEFADDLERALVALAARVGLTVPPAVEAVS